MKIGIVAFGGGYAILPLLEREFIAKRGWLTQEEALEYMTIAQITPGIIAVNVCTFIGEKRAGAAGGIAATLGFILPGITLVLCVSAFLRGVAGNPVVQHAFAGIRLAAAALIAQSVFKMTKGLCARKNGAFKNAALLVLCAASFVLSAFFKTNPVFIVAGAALAGALLFRGQEGGAK
jgi:chromate transporter